jgi:hypothetical protein
MGFKRSRADECVRIRGEKGERVITGTYTDDVTILSDEKDGVERMKRELSEKYGLKDGGDLNWMLGIKVTRDRKNRTIRLSQQAYAERILERFNMGDCNAAKTPLLPGQKFSTSDQPKTDEEVNDMKNVPYREALGAIMYLATCTRPDLAYAMQFLSRPMSNPGRVHWNALKHVLRYIKGTIDFGITYDGNNADGITPIAYADSSFGDCQETGRSTQGYIVMMAGGPVSWSSKRQECVTLSTGEAEYVALAHVGKTMVWMRNFLSEIGIMVEGALQIRGDNKASAAIASKTVKYSRAKHIQLPYFWLREYVRDKTLKILHIPGISNVSDIMTKPVTLDVNNRHVLALGLAS